jgi:hypothetical protein
MFRRSPRLIHGIRSLINLRKNVDNGGEEKEYSAANGGSGSDKCDDGQEGIHHCQHDGFLKKELFLGELVHFRTLQNRAHTTSYGVIKTVFAEKKWWDKRLS